MPELEDFTDYKDTELHWKDPTDCLKQVIHDLDIDRSKAQRCVVVLVDSNDDVLRTEVYHQGCSAVDAITFLELAKLKIWFEAWR